VPDYVELPTELLHALILHDMIPVDAMTKSLTPLVLLFGLTIAAAAQTPTEGGEARALAPDTVSDSLEERNKALARAFYEDLWFSDRTDRFDRYVADEYVVHDIGERKNVTEAAIRCPYDAHAENHKCERYSHAP
jgi:hypothetical protein